MDELAGLPAGRIDLDSMQKGFRHVLGIDGHCFRSCRYHGFEVSSPPLGGFPVVAAIENPTEAGFVILVVAAS